MRKILLAAALLWPSVAAVGADIPPNVITSPLAFTATTALLTGQVAIAIKVPGTFEGVSCTTNCRYFSFLDINSDENTYGDYIDDFTVSDLDGVVPSGARSQFPDYPIIIDFSVDAAAVSGGKSGYYLDRLGHVRIQTFSGEPQILPSGLYLTATIRNGSLLSRSYRINVVWGRPT